MVLFSCGIFLFLLFFFFGGGVVYEYEETLALLRACRVLSNFLATNLGSLINQAVLTCFPPNSFCR